MWHLTKEKRDHFCEWLRGVDAFTIPLPGSWGRDHTAIAVRYAEDCREVEEAQTDYAAVRGAELFAWTERVLAAGGLNAELVRQGDLLVYAVEQRVPFVLPRERESSGPPEDAGLCECGHGDVWHVEGRECIHQTFRGGELLYCECERWVARYPEAEGE
ncbi:hypothetical protein LCGC14_1043010 [marine sediment metagenome]|uniref:Uncharacterized protein n=1 Tax=marine sediment metagenome TaxID=412755 RepID=A0A0F9QXG2_9ZZZZ